MDTNRDSIVSHEEHQEFHNALGTANKAAGSLDTDGDGHVSHDEYLVGQGGGRTLSESYFIALKTTGIAIFYTALTLAAGVAMWIFSDLKFQADMGIMLTFMFVVNMVAAIVFLPALCRWLLRPNEKDDWVAHV
jgi:hypothetical protein